MDQERRRALIARYREGPAVVEAALAGATDAELDARPGPGEWTAREVAHHLADSEATAYVRLRRLLAEDRPVIAAYDEEEFARRLRYDRPVATSLAVVAAVREASAELLGAIAEADWAREGAHPEHGRYDVEGWLGIYAAHPHDHAAQIARAREAAAAVVAVRPPA